MTKNKQHKEDVSNNPFAEDKKILEEEKSTSEVPVEEVETQETTEESVEDSELSKLQKSYDELNNQYIRLVADFDNYRKRQAQERENLLKYGAEETLKKLIEVLDNFDRGQKAIEKIDDCNQIKDSYNLVCNQMYDVLTKLGMEEINEAGVEFDPNFHEAVMRTPSAEHEENTVIAVLQKGYKLEDKVLRAALVNVATAE